MRTGREQSRVGEADVLRHEQALFGLGKRAYIGIGVAGECFRADVLDVVTRARRMPIRSVGRFSSSRIRIKPRDFGNRQILLRGRGSEGDDGFEVLLRHCGEVAKNLLFLTPFSKARHQCPERNTRPADDGCAAADVRVTIDVVAVIHVDVYIN